MIDTLISYIRGGVQYVRRHPELLFTLALLVIIPLAFLWSSEQFLRASNDNQERLEKDRIGLMHDVFTSLLIVTNFTPSVAQHEIERIVAGNSDITKFRVVQETDAGLVVVAALDREMVGIIEKNEQSYSIAHINKPESVIVPYRDDGIRYWQSFKLVTSPYGDNYFVFTETSLASIDALFAERMYTAYLWLFALVGIVLLLMLRHVRLIDYGRLYKEAKDTIAAKDLFINMIAHELRTPLTAIRGYASMIEENNDISAGIKEQARRIEESSARLVLIVNDLLDVARIQSGRLSITKEKVDLTGVVHSVIESLSVQTMEKGVQLTHEGAESTISITSDGKRLHQALTNLVGNAIKYTIKGEIAVSLEEKSDRVEIRVKDTGMGIDAASQKKLFAPFFRVENSEVEQITGTGLGMWITKHLIELLGGSIGVESIKGVGTHIVVTLPKN